MLVLFLLSGILLVALTLQRLNFFPPDLESTSQFIGCQEENIFVSTDAETPKLHQNVDCTPSAGFLLHRTFPINRATRKELELLPGIGPSLAQQIFSFRLKNGPITEPHDLIAIPGIGEKTAARLQPLLSFEP